MREHVGGKSLAQRYIIRQLMDLQYLLLQGLCPRACGYERATLVARLNCHLM